MSESKETIEYKDIECTKCKKEIGWYNNGNKVVICDCEAGKREKILFDEFVKNK